MGLLLVPVLETLSPPATTETSSLSLQLKAFCLNNIEEYFSYKIGCTCIRHPETGSESVQGKIKLIIQA